MVTATIITRPVLPELWGKDHWSTLAYAETCTVEGHPLSLGRMRCDVTRHPLLASCRVPYTGQKYPTRLRDGVELPDHDDWDCLCDAQQAGLIKVMGLPEGVLDVEPGRRGGLFIHLRRRTTSLGSEWAGKPRVKFTQRGWEVMHLLRQHKGSGGSFGTFVWKEIPG